jgi:RHS repeat-associated protein
MRVPDLELRVLQNSRGDRTMPLAKDRLESSASRTVLDNNAYAPFGEPYAQTGNGEISFTGQNKDTVWLQYDFLLRQLDPKQGRWISPDPAGLAAVDPASPQSWNRYAYVLNNPLAMVDLLGDDGCYDPSSNKSINATNSAICTAFGGSWVVDPTQHSGQQVLSTSVFTYIATGSAFGPTSSPSSPSIDDGYISAYANPANNSNPYSISVYVPAALGYGGYTYTYTHLAANGQPTYNCSSHSGTISTLAAKAAVSGGPLTPFGRSTTSSANVISSWGWNFSLQALPWLGYQVNINSSGVVGGFTFGVPGASVSYGWGSCKSGD